MTAYLLRRLLLVIPTLFGIIAINFAVIQFAPGGPVEQMIAELRGKGDLSSPARRSRIGVRRRRRLSRRARARPAHRRRHQEDVRLRQAAADALRRHGRRLSALRLRPQLLPRPDRAATDPAEDAGLDLARSVVDAAGVSASRSRSASPRRCATAAGSIWRAAPSCWSAMPSRASCSPSCWSCCSPAAASSTGSRCAA